MDFAPYCFQQILFYLRSRSNLSSAEATAALPEVEAGKEHAYRDLVKYLALEEYMGYSGGICSLFVEAGWGVQITAEGQRAKGTLPDERVRTIVTSPLSSHVYYIKCRLHNVARWAFLGIGAMYILRTSARLRITVVLQRLMDGPLVVNSKFKARYRILRRNGRMAMRCYLGLILLPRSCQWSAYRSVLPQACHWISVLPASASTCSWSYCMTPVMKSSSCQLLQRISSCCPELKKEKKRKVYAVRRCNGSFCTHKQPETAALSYMFTVKAVSLQHDHTPQLLIALSLEIDKGAAKGQQLHLHKYC